MGRKKRRNRQAVVDRAKAKALNQEMRTPVPPRKYNVSYMNMWPEQDEVLADIREAVIKSQP